jgi:hypothetical protein
LVAEADLRGVDVLEWLFATGAGLVEHPAVIAAAQAALLDDAIAEVRAAMRAAALQEAVVGGQVLVEHEVFAEQPDRLGGGIIQFGDGRDRVPVAAQQRAHPGARADLGEQTVTCLAQHAVKCTSFRGGVTIGGGGGPIRPEGRRCPLPNPPPLSRERGKNNF